MESPGKTRFSSLSMSALLHAGALLLMACLAAALPDAPMIAPDRIKIISIDLKDVEVSGLDTNLRNMEAGPAEPVKSEDAKPVVRADRKKKPETVMKEIKVNREMRRLDRTMTVSVIDALRVAMTRCWQIDSERHDLAGIRAVAHIKLWRNGKVQSYWFEQAARADRDPAFAYVLDTIMRALEACSPFSMLPRGEYEKWKSVQLTFFPTAKSVE
ncbi:MAG: hypothetical protein LBB08_02835 [Rickettsiales bacterium]|jgi:hypothetical protein|nr:hypothetical protein [Rickettsiales bacterium]